MKKNLRILLVLSIFPFLLMTQLSAATGSDDNREIGKSFVALIKKHHFKESTLGLYVEDEGKQLLAINESKLLIPASLTKIVTGGAILSKIPLNKKFVTEFWSKALPEGQNLKGSLCLKGGGDPSFVSERLWFLTNELFRTGIRKIEGDLIMDSSRFDQELFDNGRDKTRVDRAFDAPISALSFNWNSVNVFIKPGAKVGGPVRVFLDPENDYLELENKTKTVEQEGVKSISVARIEVGKKDKIVVSGNLSKNAKEFITYKSISNPILWTASHVKEFLKQRGIVIKGDVKLAECENESTLLASVNSKNLNEIISDMLKFSNNYVAEMLVKNLAAEDQFLKLDPSLTTSSVSKNATMKDGVESLKTYLDKLGMDRDSYVLKNVSGLTRENKFTAKQLAMILENIKNDFLIFPEFLSGLPIAGMDGTMKNRLKGDTVALVRAKTGYLDGVVGLAGFVGRKNKSPLVFVFMFNGEFEQGIAAKALFDDFIKEITL